jgi:hypothetical protein
LPIEGLIYNNIHTLHLENEICCRYGEKKSVAKLTPYMKALKTSKVF